MKSGAAEGAGLRGDCDTIVVTRRKRLQDAIPASG